MTATSSSSTHHNKPRESLPVWMILALTTVLSVGVYLLVSAIIYQIGFPLDDAWIHQTYARNLALHGEWTFLPGKTSGGSTAPLWSSLLAIGFVLRIAPFVWTFLLGVVALWGMSMLGEKIVRDLVPTYRPRFPWVGMAMALEWHLVWAAASGMETLLFSLLVTGVLLLLISGTKKYFRLAVLIGLSVWLRPDGITLLAPALLVILIYEPSWMRRLRALINLGLGFGSPFTLYLLFNLIISGRAWPNTFYAKQAEYAVYQQIPFFERLGSEALQPLIGVGVILLPGVVMAIVSTVRQRDWRLLVAAAWPAGFLIMYAWRLPVTYQHGRYVIPAMPIFFLLGLTGQMEYFFRSGRRGGRFFSSFWKLSTSIILLIFWGRGAFAYAQDVAFIQSEMVATSKWVSVNIPPDTLLAAHDIGALGYFGGHNLVDLAGLISPQIIPFMRDEKIIAAYLDERGVGCLVVFPDWYPNLTADLTPIYQTEAPFAPALGENNMTVYRWPGP